MFDFVKNGNKGSLNLYGCCKVGPYSTYKVCLSYEVFLNVLLNSVAELLVEGLGYNWLSPSLPQPISTGMRLKL
jgi:hypothetical protein